MNPTNTFTTLALFNLLRFPLIMLPGAASNVAEALVSVKRLQSFLLAEEIQKAIL